MLFFVFSATVIRLDKSVTHRHDHTSLSALTSCTSFTIIEVPTVLSKLFVPLYSIARLIPFNI